MSEGVFTVSLDFELHWGTRDHRTLESYRANILGGRAAIPRILGLFERYGVHATWATVGLMFFENREELLGALPARRPAYENRRLSPYEALDELGRDEAEDPFHYAASLIRQIAASKHQEVATHTFSHYYCLERGQTAEEFRADLQAAREVARRKVGVELKSLVFPRNQFNEDYVALCGEAGIRAYRGNQRSWVYEPRNQERESLLRRGVRLADSYLNLTGHHGHRLAAGTAPIDVPASRFLRPYPGRLRFLERLRLKRIQDDMTYCARNGLLYHLWWHPDNFGVRSEENLAFLERILGHFAHLREEHGMKSLNMSEASELAHAG